MDKLHAYVYIFLRLEYKYFINVHTSKLHSTKDISIRNNNLRHEQSKLVI